MVKQWKLSVCLILLCDQEGGHLSTSTPRSKLCLFHIWHNCILNRNAFKWDAYRLLVDRTPACTAQGGCLPGGSAQWWGLSVQGGCVSAQGGVCPGVGACLGGCLPRGCLPKRVYASRQWARPPCGQTDTCENITFANFVCGR